MVTDRETLHRTVFKLLCNIAPELAAETLEPTQPLRQQVDLDSMDWLNFLVSLHDEYGIAIAESDYAKLVTLDDVVDYLESRRV
jgi:acyl carrier protein